MDETLRANISIFQVILTALPPFNLLVFAFPIPLMFVSFSKRYLTPGHFGFPPKKQPTPNKLLTGLFSRVEFMYTFYEIIQVSRFFGRYKSIYPYPKILNAGWGFMPFESG